MVDNESFELFDPKALADWDGTGEFDSSPKADEKKIEEDKKVEEEEKLFDEEFLANYDEEEVGDPSPDSKKAAPAKSDKADYKMDLVRTLFKDFIKEGIIETEDVNLEEIGSYDDLAKLVAKTIKSNEYKDLTDEQKAYLQAVRSGLPPDEIMGIQADINYVKNLTDEDLKNENEAAKIVYFDFIAQGLSPERAEELTSIASQNYKFLEIAKKAKASLEKSLVSQMEQKIADKQNEMKAKEQLALNELNNLKKKVEETNEFFDGVKLNSQTKDKVVKSLFQPVAKSGDNLLNEVMEKYKSDPDYKMKLHVLHVITDGFTNFTKLQQKLETKINREFDKKLEESRLKAGGTSGGAKYDIPANSTLERLKRVI